MASTISAATLTVKITESILLNGSEQGSTNTLSVGSISQVYKRIVSCPANAETRVVDFHSAVSDATLTPLDVHDVKYIRLTNLDDSVSITISLQIDVGEDDTAADASSSILVGPGQSFIMGTPHDAIGADDDAAGLVTDLVDLESIIVQPGSSAVDVELFVASS
tara:strand:- start:344 stop:835 length:492 start_codon:yes stop_codon:yes gene_type:complete